jgi:hypothetical protein
MTPNRLLGLSGWIYALLGVFFIFSSPWVAEIAEVPLDGALIGITAFLSAACFFLAYSAFRIRFGTNSQKKWFAVSAGFFLGSMAGLGGWALGIVLAVPLTVAVLGMRDILWRKNEG